MRTIRNIRDEIDARPTLPQWKFGVRCYAVELLENFIGDHGISVWNEADRIKNLTEADLLNGAKDWKQYSHDGNAIKDDRGICARLGVCPKGADIREDKDCSACLGLSDVCIDIQAKALKEATDLLLTTIRKETVDHNQKGIIMKTIKLQFNVDLPSGVIEEIIEKANNGGSACWCDHMRLDEQGKLEVHNKITGTTRYLTKADITKGLKEYIENDAGTPIFDWNNGRPYIVEEAINEDIADSIIQVADHGWPIYV